MLPLALPLALTLLATGGEVSRVPMPEGVSAAALFDLAVDGEVVILPEHHGDPFRMAIASRSLESCASLEKVMMTPEVWPGRWKKMKNMRVLKRTPKMVSYVFQIDMFPVSPTVSGTVQVEGPGEVVFRDPTGKEGHAVFDLFDVDGKCALLYHIKRPPGQRAAFAQLITRVESRADDAGEIGGALATTRGYAVPEKVGRAGPLSARALAAWEKLSESATVIRMVRRGKNVAAIVARRQTHLRTADVLSTIRNRRAYENKVDAIVDVDHDGSKVEYTFGFFGGRVTIHNKISESGRLDAPTGVVITERVTGGDIKSGHWRWRVKPIAGGTDIEVRVDADLISGSLVWRTLAAQDPVIREGMQMQFVLGLMGDLIGGRLKRPSKPGLRALRIR